MSCTAWDFDFGLRTIAATSGDWACKNPCWVVGLRLRTAASMASAPAASSNRSRSDSDRSPQALVQITSLL